ncbi:MAG: HAD family hydrolase [Parachlamydiaceae bacterium]
MNPLSRYQLFLFDFDGLLVNTEEQHYEAYRRMLKNRGVDFDWSFDRYCSLAHYGSEQFREALLGEHPSLREIPWETLYAEKQAEIQKALQGGKIQLMPGVEGFLTELQNRGIKHAVVTHSPDALVSILREQHPVLKKIPYWVTRHDYAEPKPHPECYQLAIQKYAKEGERVIGFEDTPRGMTALMQTAAEPVIVTKVAYPEIGNFTSKGAKHYFTFNEVHTALLQGTNLEAER